MSAVESPIELSAAAPCLEEVPADGNKAYIFQAIWFRHPNGAERFREYLTAASPIAARYGARRVDGLLPIETIRGTFEPDYIFVVEWPNLEQYYKFLKDVHYQAVAPMREQAVAKVTVLNCRRVG